MFFGDKQTISLRTIDKGVCLVYKLLLVKSDKGGVGLVKTAAIKLKYYLAEGSAYRLATRIPEIAVAPPHSSNVFVYNLYERTATWIATPTATA